MIGGTDSNNRRDGFAKEARDYVHLTLVIATWVVIASAAKQSALNLSSRGQLTLSPPLGGAQPYGGGLSPSVNR